MELDDPTRECTRFTHSRQQKECRYHPHAPSQQSLAETVMKQHTKNLPSSPPLSLLSPLSPLSLLLSPLSLLSPFSLPSLPSLPPSSSPSFLRLLCTSCNDTRCHSPISLKMQTMVSSLTLSAQPFHRWSKGHRWAPIRVSLVHTHPWYHVRALRQWTRWKARVLGRGRLQGSCPGGVPSM